MKYRLNYVIASTILMSILFYSCKHEVCVQEYSDCISETFPCDILPQSGNGWNSYYDSILYTVPYFLPNSNTEFYAIRQYLTSSSSSYDLIKYNLATKETIIITQNVPSYSSLAVSKDWVVFTNWQNQKLYKVSVNGGAPILISKTNDLYNDPIFFSDKQSLLLNVDNRTNKVYKLDLNGNLMDTLPSFMRYLACSINNEFAGFSARQDSSGSWIKNVMTYNIQSNKMNILYEKKDSASGWSEYFESMSWHPNGRKFFVTSRLGLWSINIDTKELILIRPSICDSRGYTSVNVSSDGTKLVCCLYINKPLGGQDVQRKRVVTVMNIDGSCEKQVLGL
jgi:hypothetical protein